MSRRKTIIFSIILLLVIFVLATRDERIQRDNHVYVVINRLDVGQGRTILILLREEFLEVPAYFYEIHVNDQIVIPMTFLYSCCGPNSSFRSISSRDNSVVGAFKNSEPGVLRVLHDFSSGESWPRHAHDTFETNDARGRKLRDILQADHPQTKLVLESEVKYPLHESTPTYAPPN